MAEVFVLLREALPAENLIQLTFNLSFFPKEENHTDGMRSTGHEEKQEYLFASPLCSDKVASYYEGTEHQEGIRSPESEKDL
jgi:hypothetical protein